MGTPFYSLQNKRAGYTAALSCFKMIIDLNRSRLHGTTMSITPKMHISAAAYHSMGCLGLHTRRYIKDGKTIALRFIRTLPETLIRPAISSLSIIAASAHAKSTGIEIQIDSLPP